MLVNVNVGLVRIVGAYSTTVGVLILEKLLGIAESFILLANFADKYEGS